jgi:hypothetical protein
MMTKTEKAQLATTLESVRIDRLQADLGQITAEEALRRTGVRLANLAAAMGVEIEEETR